MKRKYTLRVSGQVSFGDEDKELERRLLSGCFDIKDGEAIRLAIQELEETATSVYFQMDVTK